MRRIIFVGMIWVLFQSAAIGDSYQNVDSVSDLHNPRKFPGKGTVAEFHRAEARSAKAIESLHAKDYEGAIAGAEEAIQIYPYEADFYNQLAIALWQRKKPGDLERGIENVRRATEIRPDTCMYWNNLGRGLTGVDKWEEAREALVRASQCNTTPQNLAEIQANIQITDQMIAKQRNALPGPYIEELQRRIKGAWFPPAGHESEHVRDRVSVVFKIHRDGTMSNLRVDRSSGGTYTDQAVLKAVEGAGAFAPLPAAMEVVEMLVTFDLNNGDVHGALH